MAQLKDSIVSGNLRVTDEILTSLLQTGILRIPTSSGGTTYGLGTSGQIIKTNGSSVYWADDNNTNYYHSTGSWSGLTYTATANGGAPALALTIPTGTTSTTVALGNHTHNYAGSSAVGGAATTARKIVNDTIRPDSPNTAYYDAGLRYYLVSSAMTTDKPLNSDGGILDMQWDNNGGWGTQFYIKHAGTTLTRAAVRSQYGTTWGSWLPVGVFSETTPTSGQIVITDGTDGGIKSSGYTIATSVPANAVFTDEKVKQTLNSENKNYPLIFSKQETSSTTSPVTEDVYRNNSIYANPSTGDLTTTSGRITGKIISELSTGTGTAAQDRGSGQTNRYVPAKWTFNTGKTATDGDIITIKIPVAGHDFGVYMSIDNGVNYYPIVCNSTGRLTTHYPVNNYITVVFEPGGSAASMFALNGGDSRITVTGGVWRVINYYDANSDTKVRQTLTNGDTNRPILLAYSANTTTTGNVDNICYRDNDFYYNPSTNLLTVPNISVTKINGATVGNTPVFTDRYVNSASFAHDSTNNNVKMTLTRAGSDTNTVTANIPLVSSSTAGVAPKGASVSSQSQSTKFLREDGSWATPSYTTNTDTKVTQINTTNTTEDDSYRILFSNTADNTNRTEAARKSAYLLFTPNSKTLTTTNLSVTDNLYIGRSGSTTGKIYFFSTSNNTSMYGRIEQTFNPTQSNPVHKLPSTSGTLLNDTDFNEIHEVIFDDTNSGTTATNPIDFDITDEIDQIKYIDILYTDTNYQKIVEDYNVKQKSENFGFLRIPFDKVRYTYSISANVPSTLFSLSLIGDKNSYYIRKQTYALSIVQSGSQQTDPTYTLDIREFNSGLVIQFYGTPGTGTYANMTTRAQYTNAIRILKVVLIKELKEQQ